MYWFYSYMWQNKFDSSNPWEYDMDVFKGGFDELILFSQKQPEKWVITFAKEISESEFKALEGEIG